MIGETCMDQILKAVRRDQRFRNHPKNFKKARKANRRLRTIAGRLIREAERNLKRRQKLDSHADTINLFKKVLGQKRDDKDKVYSLHEPEVKCISKGKEHKKYEFGNKVSIARSYSGIIVGAVSFRDEYDGHAIDDTLNVKLAAAGYNFKRAMRLFFALFERLYCLCFMRGELNLSSCRNTPALA